jgi:hypothetical protein
LLTLQSKERTRETIPAIKLFECILSDKYNLIQIIKVQDRYKFSLEKANLDIFNSNLFTMGSYKQIYHDTRWMKLIFEILHITGTSNTNFPHISKYKLRIKYLSVTNLLLSKIHQSNTLSCKLVKTVDNPTKCFIHHNLKWIYLNYFKLSRGIILKHYLEFPANINIISCS